MSKFDTIEYEERAAHPVRRRRVEMSGFCTGDTCIFHDKRKRTKQATDTVKEALRLKYLRQDVGVKKNVPYGTHDCPDCGYALFWRPNVGLPTD